MTVTPFDRRILEEGDTASSNPAADHADQLQRVPILQGRIVDVSWETGERFVTAPHGLARRYIGAIVIGQTATSRDVRARTPEVVDSATVSDGDSKINFEAVLSGNATEPLTARFWVF